MSTLRITSLSPLAITKLFKLDKYLFCYNSVINIICGLFFLHIFEGVLLNNSLISSNLCGL